MTHAIKRALDAFRRNESGVTALEYGVIMAFLSGALLITLPYIGSSIANPITQLTEAINTGATSGGDGEGEDGSDDDGESDHDDDHADDGHDDEGDDDYYS